MITCWRLHFWGLVHRLWLRLLLRLGLMVCHRFRLMVLFRGFIVLIVSEIMMMMFQWFRLRLVHRHMRRILLRLRMMVCNRLIVMIFCGLMMSHGFVLRLFGLMVGQWFILRLVRRLVLMEIHFRLIMVCLSFI